MKLAKNNIIVKMNTSNPAEYAIMNPISGSFDIMDEGEYTLLKGITDYNASFNSKTSTCNNETVPNNLIPDDFASYLLERGYAYENSSDETTAVNAALEAFNKEVQNSQVQLMLVPTYHCNFSCTYCFQHGIEGKPALISKEQVDAFFVHAQNNFSTSPTKPFITLFGGEPLINSPTQREIISYITDKCKHYDYELSIVTNGYDLADYIDILKKIKIKEIQVTLDGSPVAHDQRRKLANGDGTFKKILKGVKAAVEHKMPINLRSVVDLENINDLISLAQILDENGWLDLPDELFKTQLGRNYELFDCYAKPQHLMSQVELWAEYSKLSKKHSILQKFLRPDFKGVRHLVDTGELYMASFDTCPACKTEWVFDLYGNIYGCTASCGREEFLLGKYWPKVELNEAAVNTWKTRSVKTIDKCATCKYDVVCGGGCGVVAANQNSGEILSPDCRPIQELLEIGINHYADEIFELSNDARVEPLPACKCSAKDCLQNIKI